MRKMQNYRLKGKDIFVGLEDSKKSWKVCVRSEELVIHETSMPAGYEVLINYLRGNYPGCKIQLMYEAGFGGFWLHDRLEEDGIDCIVTPPNKVTQAKVNKVKTDRVDARRLARNLESGDYISCDVPDRERREDRQVVRTMVQIQKVLVATRNRIRKLLDFHGLNGDLPAGSWKSRDYKQVRKLEISDVLHFCLDIQLDLLDYLEGKREELKSWLKKLSQSERYREAVKAKSSCVGVGWLSAIRFTLEWGDMSRFAGGKQLASYTGLTSSEYSTGESVHRGHITHQGNGQVRAWLIQCAWKAIRQDGVLLSKYRRVKGPGEERKKKAIVAVARKLAVRMRAVELSGQPYVCSWRCACERWSCPVSLMYVE